MLVIVIVIVIVIAILFGILNLVGIQRGYPYFINTTYMLINIWPYSDLI
ncbi:Uncharacterised protein [Yersinia frederiksenii]|nr:Uncharacterised protein [Yersinia frederiksenii]